MKGESVLKKFFLLILVVIAVMVSCSKNVLASSSSQNIATFEISKVELNTVTLSVYVHSTDGYGATLYFGDELKDRGGLFLENGRGVISHEYFDIGNYSIKIVIANSAIIQGVNINNIKNKTNTYDICPLKIDKNKLWLQVQSSEEAPLYFGDETYTVQPKGTTEVSHDYEYNVWGTREYILTMGSLRARFVINDNGEKSTFAIIPENGLTKIIEWNDETPPLPSLIINNDWSLNNLIILDVGTEIKYAAGNEFGNKLVVKNSFWIAKVISSVKTINGDKWWNIILGDSSTGWVKEPYSIKYDSFFK